MAEPTIKELEGKVVALEQKLETQLTAQSLAHVSKIYPKEKTVVFVGINYFGDNIKYAYLAFREYSKNKNVTCHFLIEDQNQQKLLKAAGISYLSSSDPHYIQTLLSTKIAVLYDNFYPQNAGGPIPHALLQGAKFIQLWHGIPLKEIGLQSFSHVGVMAGCGPFEALIATNQSSLKAWQQRFSFHEFAALGYPRNDVFFRDLTKSDLINVDEESLSRIKTAQHQGKLVILYSPTFRDHAGPAWFAKADILSFADFCRSRDCLLCINLHPSEQGATAELRRRYPNLWFLAPYMDIYPIVKNVDLLMTDYSSLALDFLLRDKPLLFYRPDHEDYVANSRPLIKGREYYTPGAISYNIESLIKTGDAALNSLDKPSSDTFRNARRALRNELFDHHDGKAANRICKLIMKYLEAP